MNKAKLLSIGALATTLLASGCSTATAEPIAARVTGVDLHLPVITTEPIYAVAVRPSYSGTIILEDEDIDEDTTAVPPIEGDYAVLSEEYALSDKCIEFLSRCTFVGDSICCGLKNFKILPADHVYAMGNVGVRNVFDDWVTFTVDGTEVGILSVLEQQQPEYIVCWMGMNDVNFFDADTYIANYDKFITTVHEVVPDAKFIALSTTPVAYREDGKIFTYNSSIDEFNAKLKEYCICNRKATYVDVSHELKTWDNTLNTKYLGTADGVHLDKSGYLPVMQAFEQRVVFGKEWEPGDVYSDVAPIAK